MLPRRRAGRGATGYAQSHENAFQVLLHRARADAQPCTDFTVASAPRQIKQDFRTPQRQPQDLQSLGGNGDFLFLQNQHRVWIGLANQTDHQLFFPAAFDE